MNQRQRLLRDEQQLVTLGHRQAHHLGDVCQIWGELDTDAFLRAVRLVAGSNQVLRSRFPSPEWVEIGDEPLVDATVRDVSALTSEEVEGIVHELIWRPFDLANGPCWRVCLLRRHVDRWVLVMSFDHLVIDGYGLDLFKRQLSNAYAMARRGQDLDASGSQDCEYYDWSDLQLRKLDHETRVQILTDWQRDLNVAKADLDLRWPPYTKSSPNPSRVAHRLSPRSTRRGLAIAAELRTTPYTVLLSAFVRALGRYTENGASDAVVVPYANRVERKFLRTIGWMSNISLVPCAHAPDGNFRETVGFIQQRVRALKRRAAVPLFALGRRTRSPYPAWAYFDLRDGTAGNRLRLEGIQINDFPLEDPSDDVNAYSGYDLIVHRESANHFALSGIYNTSKISPYTAKAILETLDEEIK